MHFLHLSLSKAAFEAGANIPQIDRITAKTEDDMSTITLPRTMRGPSILAPIARFLHQWRPSKRVYLSARMARDIGLDPGQGPIGRIPLPSEVWTHPRL